MTKSIDFHLHCGFLGQHTNPRLGILHLLWLTNQGLDSDRTGSPRKKTDPKVNDELLLEFIDLIDEKRDDAELRVAAYQKKAAQHFNTKIQRRTFEVGDLVLKRVILGTRVLDPN